MRELDLADNEATARGARAAARFVAARLDSLESLDLSHNNFGEQGVSALAAAATNPLSRARPALRVLTLRNCGSSFAKSPPRRSFLARGQPPLASPLRGMPFVTRQSSAAAAKVLKSFTNDFVVAAADSS